MNKYFKRNFSIEGPLHPTIVKSVVDGKRYAVCGGNWVQIPNNMTYEEVKAGWISTIPKTIEIPKISKSVESSRGKGSYTVSHNNGNWSCTCSGYGFRKKCSHIEKLKKEYTSE